MHAESDSLLDKESIRYCNYSTFRQMALTSRRRYWRQIVPIPFLLVSSLLEAKLEMDSKAFDAIIVVMGAKGSGQTSFIENVTGVKRVTNRFDGSDIVLSDSINVDNVRVAFLDTPEFDNIGIGISDMQMLTEVTACVDSLLEGNWGKFAGVVFLHSIQADPGTTFSVFELFHEFCGYGRLENVTIATTNWSIVPKKLELATERAFKQDSFYTESINQGAHYARHRPEYWRSSGLDIITRILEQFNRRVPTNSLYEDLQNVQYETSYIMIMGATGAGKSSFINAVGVSNLTIGNTLRSCTSEVNFSNPVLIDGHPIVLLDTPGFNDTDKSDTEILADIAGFLGTFQKEREKLIGVIYLHDITATRVGGSAVRNIEMFNMVVGNTAARNVVVVTTKWDIVEAEVGAQRETELKEDPKFFEPILTAGASILRYGKGISPRNIIRYMLKRHDTPVTLQIQKEMEEGKGIDGTAAGGVLKKEITKALKEAEEEHAKELEEMRQRMKNELNQELERTRRSIQVAHQSEVARIEARSRR